MNLQEHVGGTNNAIGVLLQHHHQLMNHARQKEIMRAALLMGQKINDYELGALLGKGGFGCVYEARSKHTGQKLAIKIMDKKLVLGANVAMKVASEIAIHSFVDHPSIVKLYHYFEDNNFVYLVLELCSGGALYRYIKTKGKMTEDQSKSFIRQIVEGLVYLHERGIMHRDLKLANLLLTEDMRVKIADFGLAAKIMDDEERQTLCGTPNYISPEIVGHQKYGLKVDVWALGCILYNFLVGRPPFESEQALTTMVNVAKSSYTLPNHLSEDAKDLIRKMLQKDPLSRISVHEVLGHPFLQQLARPAEPISNVNALREQSQRTSRSVSTSRERRPGSNDNNNNNNQQDAPLQPQLQQRMVRQRADSPATAPLPEKSPRSARQSRQQQEDQQPHGTADKMNHKAPLETRRDTDRVPEEKIVKAKQRSLSRSRQRSEESDKNQHDQSQPQQLQQKSTNYPTSMLIPLSTKRIRPRSHKSERANAHILADGNVCIEFLRDTEIMFVSGDGNHIRFSSANNPIENYTLRELPQHLHDKYRYAYSFVELVRSKTPKVTLYSEHAKCMIMENIADPLPHFEIDFTDPQYAHSSESIVYYRSHSRMVITDMHCISVNDDGAETKKKRTFTVLVKNGFMADEDNNNTIMSYLTLVKVTSSTTTTSQRDQQQRSSRRRKEGDTTDNEFDHFIHNQDEFRRTFAHWVPLLAHLKRCLRKCLEIEQRGMDQFEQTGTDPFPIVVRLKPKSQMQQQQHDRPKQNNITPQLATLTLNTSGSSPASVVPSSVSSSSSSLSSGPSIPGYNNNNSNNNMLHASPYNSLVVPKISSFSNNPYSSLNTTVSSTSASSSSSSNSINSLSSIGGSGSGSANNSILNSTLNNSVNSNNSNNSSSGSIGNDRRNTSGDRSFVFTIPRSSSTTSSSNNNNINNNNNNEAAPTTRIRGSSVPSTINSSSDDDDHHHHHNHDTLLQYLSPVNSTAMASVLFSTATSDHNFAPIQTTTTTQAQDDSYCHQYQRQQQHRQQLQQQQHELVRSSRSDDDNNDAFNKYIVPTTNYDSDTEASVVNEHYRRHITRQTRPTAAAAATASQYHQHTAYNGIADDDRPQHHYQQRQPQHDNLRRQQQQQRCYYQQQQQQQQQQAQPLPPPPAAATMDWSIIYSADDGNSSPDDDYDNETPKPLQQQQQPLQQRIRQHQQQQQQQQQHEDARRQQQPPQQQQQQHYHYYHHHPQSGSSGCGGRGGRGGEYSSDYNNNNNSNNNYRTMFW